MKLSQRNLAIGMLGVLSIFMAAGPAMTTVLAWNPCSLTLSPSGQVNTVPAGSTSTFTYLLTYTDTGYPASFGISATSSNGAWTIVSVSPNQVPSSGTSSSVSQTITVKITAPVTVGSTTSLTVKAVNQQDGGADCSTSRTLTSSTAPPPPGVPQFPLGVALLMALAIPALLAVKSKHPAVVKQ